MYLYNRLEDFRNDDSGTFTLFPKLDERWPNGRYGGAEEIVYDDAGFYWTFFFVLTMLRRAVLETGDLSSRGLSPLTMQW